MNPLPRIVAGFDRILHGGDYNPDQWQRYPEVLAEDERLIAQAGLNVVTLGVFAWSSYEPREAQLEFGWLDRALDAMDRIGCKVILATPSGAKPAWMSEKYPEVRRVTRDGLREPHTGRHNHCWSSPVFREKVRIINTALAERYAGRPTLCMWHVSNEYAGKCYCELCRREFQRFLRDKYGTIEALNDAWWSAFWSYGFADFSEIDPRSQLPSGMNLDHNQFQNRQLIDFMRWEMMPLRELTPAIPCTSNFMGTFGPNDYSAIAEHVDVVCDDQYPNFDAADPALAEHAAAVSFKNDLYRALKPERPWMLMESSPDVQNWRQPMRLKRPGLHRLEMLQALAHGAEGTLYFQLRKSRGGSEQFHGAVIDHSGSPEARVFRAVLQVSRDHERLTPLLGTRTQAEVAFIYDWPARWAFELASGPMSKNDAYDRVCHAHYRAFWSRGVSVDVLSADKDFSRYRVLVTPQLFALAPDVAARIAAFVAAGGVWVATHYTAYSDPHGRCYMGGFPGAGLRRVLGLWNEEVDSLPDGVRRRVTPTEASQALCPLPDELAAESVCEVVRLEGAEALALYAEDFYAGHAALSVNRFGRGRAYYHAARLSDAGLDAFYGGLIRELALPRALDADLPRGVTAQRRWSEAHEYVFLLSFAAEPRDIALGERSFTELLSGEQRSGAITLPAFGVAVLEAKRGALT
jgi:beta-galactosidase